MKNSTLDRRDFNRLTSAAFGGMVAGSVLGCDQQQASRETADAGGDADVVAEEGSGTQEETTEEGAAAQSLLIDGKNVCRGLNHQCGGHKGGDNSCAGKGSCATAAAHDCHASNECKGEGGCGSKVGQNSCKGKGECAVPLGDKAWKTAREAFEKAMTEAGKKFGDAPPKS